MLQICLNLRLLNYKINNIKVLNINYINNYIILLYYKLYNCNKKFYNNFSIYDYFIYHFII